MKKRRWCGCKTSSWSTGGTLWTVWTTTTPTPPQPCSRKSVVLLVRVTRGLLHTSSQYSECNIGVALVWIFTQCKIIWINMTFRLEWAFPLKGHWLKTVAVLAKLVPRLRWLWLKTSLRTAGAILQSLEWFYADPSTSTLTLRPSFNTKQSIFCFVEFKLHF